MPKKDLNIVVIADSYFCEEADLLHHSDDFQLSADGVVLSFPNLMKYFGGWDGLGQQQKSRLALKELERPYRQIKANGLHIYSLISKAGYKADLINCFTVDSTMAWKALNKENLVVVISTTFISANKLRKIVSAIREKCAATFIVGGPLVRQSKLIWERQNTPDYAYPEFKDGYIFLKADEDKHVHYYIYDEHGEQTLLALLGRMGNDETPDKKI